MTTMVTTGFPRRSSSGSSGNSGSSSSSSHDIFDFQRNFTFEQRLAESQRILGKYPDRVPIICERHRSARADSTTDIDKNKFLVPADMNLGQFVFVIRKRTKMSAERGLYLFINGVIPPTHASVLDLYQHHKHTDGYLYVHYATEATFGSE